MKTPARRHPFTIVFAAALGIFSGGCATSYKLKVDAISRPAKGVSSYNIRSKKSPAETETLRAQEAELFVKTALSGKGFYEAANPESADLVVEIDYGMEAPRVRMERSTIPIYAQTGGGIRYEARPTIDAKGMSSIRTIPVYDPPQTEMVGYQEIVTPVQIYEKYLRISAHENKPVVEGKAPLEIWSVNVTSEDESKDLRKYLPLLASASAAYIGADTHVEKVVKLKESDPGVGFVRNGM